MTLTSDTWLTPYERGNQNQTTHWRECIEFYELLAQHFPKILQFKQIGIADSGIPIHAGVVTGDGVFERSTLQAAARPIFFNNNGIHPGEPEGIDACMAIIRDFCTKPEHLAQLGPTVYLFIAIYNVDGCNNRNASSRVNQDGPENFGFRGNSLHLDLNRDFIKCDSLAAQCFNQFFSAWQPDVMVDTHTSNGADYPYTMTLIATQPDKLGGELGQFLRATILPAIYDAMEQRGWPTCPYVNPVHTSPDQGIADFLEVPRFSTGYAALHHCIGFMPETHMLKPFADRYESMRTLLQVILEFTVQHGAQIQALRRAAKQQVRSNWPVCWETDMKRPARLRFRGYAAVYKPSLLGNYQRLAYDRNQVWEQEIDHFDHCLTSIEVSAPKAYVIPQQWRAVIERLQWNGVRMTRIERAQSVAAQIWRITRVVSRTAPYEGHLFHDEVELAGWQEDVMLQPGDYWLDLNQPNARYAVETLEPQAHDSFFRWGFFNSVLEKKEAYSDYVFEDHALELLQTEAALRSQFEAWKVANPDLVGNQSGVLDFIFSHCERYREPEWRRYPVVRILA
jgi:Zinc carboxypeptidase